MNELTPDGMIQRLERLVLDLGPTRSSEALVLIKEITTLLRQQNSEIEKLRSNISNIFEDLAKATGEWSYYYISVGKGGYLVSDVHKTLAELRKKYKEENHEI